MCGIFGVVFGKDTQLTAAFAGGLIDRLYRYSQTRGSEAAGLVSFNGETIDVLKQAGSVEDFLESREYRELRARALERYRENCSSGSQIGLVWTGHTRLVTNGFQSNSDNNQPVDRPRRGRACTTASSSTTPRSGDATPNSRAAPRSTPRSSSRCCGATATRPATSPPPCSVSSASSRARSRSRPLRRPRRPAAGDQHRFAVRARQRAPHVPVLRLRALHPAGAGRVRKARGQRSGSSRSASCRPATRCWSRCATSRSRSSPAVRPPARRPRASSRTSASTTCRSSTTRSAPSGLRRCTKCILPETLPVHAVRRGTACAATAGAGSKIAPKGARRAARRGRALPLEGRQPGRDRRVLAAGATRPTACTT